MTAAYGLAASVILAGALMPAGAAPASASANASPSAWQVVPSPSPPGSDTLLSVSATSPGNAWAVGTVENRSPSPITPLAEHWDGKAWHVVPVPDGVYHYENRLFSVSAFSADDAWAVGNSFGSPHKPLQPSAPLAEHWNGRSWTAVATPKAPSGAGFGGVVDLGPDDAWAVGNFSSQVAPFSHTLIEHWDGTAWHIVPSPDPGARTNSLAQVAASGPDDIWATGEDSFSLGQTLTLAEHWNGKRWSVVLTPDDPTASFNILESLAVRSPTDAWAGVFTTGNANGDFFAHWNGKIWQKVTGFGNLHGEIAIEGLAIVSPTQVWEAGGYQGIMTGLWNGTRWRRVATPAPGKAANLLEAITTVPGGNELIAVGYQQNVVSQGRTLVLVRHL